MMVQIVGDRSAVKALQVSAPNSTVKHALHNMELKPGVVDAIATRSIVSSAITAAAEIFVRKKVDKWSLKQAKME